jgi:hypothetical protein
MAQMNFNENWFYILSQLDYFDVCKIVKQRKMNDTECVFETSF